MTPRLLAAPESSAGSSLGSMFWKATSSVSSCWLNGSHLAKLPLEACLVELTCRSSPEFKLTASIVHHRSAYRFHSLFLCTASSALHSTLTTYPVQSADSEYFSILVVSHRVLCFWARSDNQASAVRKSCFGYSWRGDYLRALWAHSGQPLLKKLSAMETPRRTIAQSSVRWEWQGFKLALTAAVKWSARWVTLV